MSRTYKDRPTKLKYSDWNQDRVWIPGTFWFIMKKSTVPKKRKKVDTEEHWMSTPSRWTRIMMNRPMRARGRAWEQRVKYEISIEETDPPGVSKKPHIYYW